ncbi:MAG: phosphatidylglycerophosphatase A [Candidatus Xenolissoclinum pacificiensis L6]|uniref:Phosphatidylglycerophosphatase A n=1 Tax=Candidatus Xenolissoclinum pacificiensis L6 TaxID=1401685 RepID=W2V0U1_9RICK|nr:MAG: phosphatidylglycerophosphatase A [Candidatus Xenolissoclinum pacificiensis L6]
MAPGTVGSLMAFLFVPLIDRYRLYFAIGLFIMFFLTIYTINVYCGDRDVEGDPKEVIIDEIIAQCAVFLCLHTMNKGTMVYLALSFLIFRFFDIVKPFPISWCDQNIKGGFGVNFDDILAAFFTVILIYFL